MSSKGVSNVFDVVGALDMLIYFSIFKYLAIHFVLFVVCLQERQFGLITCKNESSQVSLSTRLVLERVKTS